MYRSIMAGVFLGGILTLSPLTAMAGPFADDMAKCLVTSTSETDRADLIRWMYSAMSEHPDLASMAQISDKQRDELTTKAGALFSRLIFQSCRAQFVASVRNEGTGTIEYAFSILGQVAMRGLMTDPHVTQQVQALGKTLDQDKLKALVAQAAKK